MTESTDAPEGEPSVRSRDEEVVGWGDERDEPVWGRSAGTDPDLDRLLDDRPPHHDRD